MCSTVIVTNIFNSVIQIGISCPFCESWREADTTHYLLNCIAEHDNTVLRDGLAATCPSENCDRQMLKNCSHPPASKSCIYLHCLHNQPLRWLRVLQLLLKCFFADLYLVVKDLNKTLTFIFLSSTQVSNSIWWSGWFWKTFLS